MYLPELVPAPTGVTTVDIDEISIYPNPATGKVYISNTAKSEISITDTLCRKIFTANAGKSKIKSIDRSKYSEGTYIVYSFFVGLRWLLSKAKLLRTSYIPLYESACRRKKK